MEYKSINAMRYLFITLVVAFILVEVATFTIDRDMVDYANIIGLLIAGWLAVNLDNKEKE